MLDRGSVNRLYKIKNFAIQLSLVVVALAVLIVVVLVEEEEKETFLFHPRDRLVGLVVKASTLRAEDPGFESYLRRDFSRVKSYQ